MTPRIDPFYDDRTGTITYVVADPATKRCAVIDPVLDFEPRSGRTWTESADRLIGFVRDQGIEVEWIVETHVHADHFTAAAHLKQALGGRIAIGERVMEVQETFKGIFNLGPEFSADGAQFDHLFGDGERFAIGGLEAEVLSTPGHTPSCCTYRIGDAAFVGDTIFMPDYGTARCDFPGADAATLYRSIGRVLALGPETRIFAGHDYGGEGRDPAWETTVALEKESNRHVKDGITEAAFVAMREDRDHSLEMPRLILPALQVNIRAGHMPPAEDNGVSYLKLPLNAL